MTTPDPNTDTPHMLAYAKLCTELAQTLPLAAGLAAILGEPAVQPAREPGQKDHSALVADLAATIDAAAGADDVIERDLVPGRARRPARKAPGKTRKSMDTTDFVALQLRLWLDQCGHPSYRKMEALSRETDHHYSRSTIQRKLTQGGTIDWQFIQTIVMVGHRHAKLPDEPDLESWRRKYEHARPQPRWVGSAPTLADSFQSRSIGVEVSRNLVPGRAFVLTGLGGVGKTQLAAAMAYRSWGRQGQVDLVVWVAADSRTAVVSAFADAAARVGVAGAGDEETAAQRFLTWLGDDRGRRWLVVLDDVRDPVDLNGLWPPTGNGNTVVTTRDEQAAFAGNDRHVITVGVFEPDESIRYLQEKLDDDSHALTALADALGHLPLALAQAAAYITNYGLNCTDYLHRLQHGRLLDVAPDKLPDEYPAVLASTWNLSIQAADDHQPTGVARPLLELAALLSPDGTPAAVFTTTAVQELLTRRRGRATTADEAWAGLINLKRLSLVGLDDDQRTVRVHQLVQRAVRETRPARRAEKTVGAADALLEIWPDVERDAILAELLRNNTDALAQKSGDALWHGRLHQVVFRVGNSLTLRGLPAAARAYWESLLPTALRYLGPGHPDTLTIRSNLAWARHETGDNNRALAEMRDLLPVRRRLLGADHPNTLAARHSIAEFLEATGDPVRAVALLVDLVDDYERAHGPDERDTLNTRALLGVMRGETESPEVAVRELRALLDDYRRTLGPHHPETLEVEVKLAGWLVSADRPGEAQSRIERLTGDFERVFGPDHIKTLRLRYYVADLLDRAGRRDEAAGHLRDLHDDVHQLSDLGRTEVKEIREWIELWSANKWASAA
jgi:hypothetical protein